jgi:hypothetical protein
MIDVENKIKMSDKGCSIRNVSSDASEIPRIPSELFRSMKRTKLLSSLHSEEMNEGDGHRHIAR